MPEFIGQFYDGLLHPALFAPHLLSSLALGLFIGRFQPGERRILLVVFGLTLLAGLGAGISGVDLYDAIVVVLAMALVSGVLVAIGRPMPAPVGWVIAAVTGAALGLDAIPEEGETPLGTAAIFVAGSAVTICLVTAVVAFCVGRATRPWHHIGIRIAGSWIAAVGIFVLALTWNGMA